MKVISLHTIKNELLDKGFDYTEDEVKSIYQVLKIIEVFTKHLEAI